MTDNHKLFLEITSTNLLGLVYALDALKNQPIEFKVIEEKKNPPKPNAQYTDSKLGQKGKEIIKLLAQGYTYKDIAQRTEISLDGVRYYIKKIFKILDANNARAAVKHYIELGGEV